MRLLIPGLIPGQCDVVGGRGRRLGRVFIYLPYWIRLSSCAATGIKRRNRILRKVDHSVAIPPSFRNGVRIEVLLRVWVGEGGVAELFPNHLLGNCGPVLERKMLNKYEVVVSI